MSSSPPLSIPGTVTQYFPFCTTIMTQILTKSEINLMVKLSKSCKYFYLKFFAIVDELEIEKNKVKCFKFGKSWNMPLGWILKYGITVTDKLTISSSNPGIITRILAKTQYSTIEELIISESYVSQNDILRLTKSIKKFKVILNNEKSSGFPVAVTTDYLIKAASNATEIHIEQHLPTFIPPGRSSYLMDLKREVKIQKLNVIGCICDIFENSFLKDNLAPKSEVLIGFMESYIRIHKFRDTIVKDLLDTWEPKDEKPVIATYSKF